jgi:hypothetical protein
LFKRLLALTTVFVAFTAFGQAADAGSQASTKLLTSFQAGSTETPDLFVVELQSTDADCIDGRKVTVYKLESGKDKKVGADKSFAGKGDSYVAIIESNATAPGKYYASVKETGGCKAAKSKKITI